ncbi:hypothetical protein Tco_1135201 [Tanacetum coccineum]
MCMVSLVFIMAWFPEMLVGFYQALAWNGNIIWNNNKSDVRFVKARVHLNALKGTVVGMIARVSRKDCFRMGNILWESVLLLVRKERGFFLMRNGGHVEVYGYAFWVNQCTNGFHGVNEPGGVRYARKDDRGVSEGREDVREVFQQRGSGAKRKLSRCGMNQMGNEPHS